MPVNSTGMPIFFNALYKAPIPAKLSNNLILLILITLSLFY